MKSIAWIVFSLLTLFAAGAQAGQPLWTLTPLTSTRVEVSTVSSATVQYTVKNQSKRSHTLRMRDIQGVSQVTTGPGICANPFSLLGEASCTLSLQIHGNQIPASIMGGPVLCQDGNPNQCYQPAAADILQVTRTTPSATATLSISIASLALSVNCPTSGGACAYFNAALTGMPRTITITNVSSSGVASNVTYSTSSLPAGTSISPLSCGDLAPGASCALTVTPGQVASTSSTTLSVSGINTNTVTASIDVLTYGNIFQGGYLFAIDDTTPSTGSVGGKVMTLADQSTGIAWDPGCPGSCTGGINANSDTDGAANSSNAYTALSSLYTPSTFAAGLCVGVAISGYSDWYLPAICEMGYDTLPSLPCGDSFSPTLQNIQSNLVDTGIVILTNPYWSSTQTYTVNPLIYATFNFFSVGGSQPGDFKETGFYARCVRMLTP